MIFPEHMKTKDKIEFLQRYILVHSYLYYELNESVISDKKFDKKARLLASKVDKYKSRMKSTQYGYVFYDFDGTTGFDLFDRLNEQDKKQIVHIAYLVLRLYKGEYR